MGTRSVRITLSIAWWWRWYVASVAAASYLTGLPPNMDKVAYWARRSVRLKVIR